MLKLLWAACGALTVPRASLRGLAGSGLLFASGAMAVTGAATPISAANAAIAAKATSPSNAASASCEAKSPAHRTALVELYTSQGCSSCPPADRWLSALPQRFSFDQAIPLSLHVGYWDYIGWKDPFARREFNDRQRLLAQWNDSRSVYTPGVFVQTAESRQWPNASGMASAIRTINTQAAAVQLSLKAQVQPGGSIAVTASSTPALANAPAQVLQDLQVVLALAQSGIKTAVKAGENKGEQLTNDHVVREWSAPQAAGRAGAASSASVATVQWPWPAGAAPSQLAVVAFVQKAGGGSPLQAVRLALDNCVR